MDRQEKKKFVAHLQTRLKRAQGTFLVDYQGLNVEAINRLRKELKNVGAEFQVVKNRLLKLSSDDTETVLIKDHMQGPSAIAITYEDVAGPAKILVGFQKEFQQLAIKSGQISGNVIDGDAVKRLAELPGRDVLLAQTLSAMQAVPGSFVRLLNGVIVKLLNVLKAIEDQKESPRKAEESTEVET
ncbi:MAG: 50S ribosomal protein L10 [Deltaproteobacteria bacterium]|nr:50S ribosomal protein L10 [Deltaproteobacteria bacterium]